MMENEVREILEPFKDRYEILSCGSCKDYLKDGLYAELKANYPIVTTKLSVSFGTALAKIEKPYVHVIKGFGNDILQLLSMIK